MQGEHSNMCSGTINIKAYSSARRAVATGFDQYLILSTLRSIDLDPINNRSALPSTAHGPCPYMDMGLSRHVSRAKKNAKICGPAFAGLPYRVTFP
jgi:hypothetical protein